MAPEKRKEGSICRQYYAMRKRIKDASFNSPDLSLFEKCNYHDCSRHGHNQEYVCHEEADSPSLSISFPDSLHLSDWKSICTLNTQDTEIPCNDDILFLVHPSTLFSPSIRPQIASIDPLSSSADEMDSEQGLDTPATYREILLHEDVGSLKMIGPESMDTSSILDSNSSDSDGDLPEFSDIEALIHGLDLEYGQESSITSEVARSQYNHNKRVIVRLEQIALSSLQRSMSYLGAFAIFYGHHFNYYIKKTEVTIGRSTDGADVDIDLRKEGCGNRISRQQATIKMGTNGSFTLKNLGKSSISVNGNSIAHGQGATLSSNCLIEVRKMSFIFEVNDRYVRLYLDNIIKESQGKSRTFEWSPEGQP